MHTNVQSNLSILLPASKHWNDFPVTIRQSLSVNIFGKSLKHIYLIFCICVYYFFVFVYTITYCPWMLKPYTSKFQIFQILFMTSIQEANQQMQYTVLSLAPYTFFEASKEENVDFMWSTGSLFRFIFSRWNQEEGGGGLFHRWWEISDPSSQVGMYIIWPLLEKWME